MTTQVHSGKKLADLTFSNRLYKTAPFLFAKVTPEALTQPKIVHINTELLNKLEIDPKLLTNPSFLRFINGDLDFEGPFFGASFYAGHQFGHYVPRLGDGRAVTLGEVETSDHHFFELQLKGSGLTPFSRMGDGRAVLRSSIREYLASAHLKALNIPTTEALSLICGEDDVYRETVEKSAMVMRVTESFLRFGHFQYYAHTNQLEELKILVDFVIDNYFITFKDHANSYVLFFQEVVKRTAKLFARWQAVGFCHGVLNTDNLSILGVTLDYGPYGFIENFDQDYICNHSDHEGRYSLGNQPGIGLWNLEMLGVALSSLISDEACKRTLATYPQIFFVEYRRLLLEKCGLVKMLEQDDDFLKSLLNMLVVTKIDYTHFFRALSRYRAEDFKLVNVAESSELREWLILYGQRLSCEEVTEGERHIKMLATNPKYILRNYMAQIVIDDPSLISKMFDILSAPFKEWNENEDWSFPAPPKYKNLSVSCSS